MKPELENYLKKKYPELYTNCGEQQPYTLFGFECNDGWFRLLLWLSEYIQNYIDTNNKWDKSIQNNINQLTKLKLCK